MAARVAGAQDLRKVDPVTAQRIQVVDPETGGMVDAINDQLLEDMETLAVLKGVPKAGTPIPDTLSFVPAERISMSCAVPAYYDHRYSDHFTSAL